MTEAEMIAHDLLKCLPDVITGTLRIWGEWFGRPYDSLLKMTEVVAEDDRLIIHFGLDGVLLIEHPHNAAFDSQTFRINGASRVRWEWFCYGRPRLPENLHYL